MIYGCLDCDAGHNLPVSTIPDGGLDVTCRRCGKVFVAHPDGRVVRVRKDLGVSLVPGANPDGHTALDKEGPTEAGAFGDGEATVEGLSAEFDSFDEPTEHAPPDDEQPALELPKSVYDRVADGEYVPEPTVDGVRASDPSINAWNDSSAPNHSLSVVARAALALNDAPLAVKTALLIFPLVLAGTLILTAGVFSGPSIEIPAQKIAPAPKRTPLPPLAEVSVPEAPVVDATTVAEETPVLALGLDDPMAPEGYLFTQPRSTRIRAEASIKARPIARLRRGRLVRLFEARGDWALVMQEPDGPAGFVAVRDLAAQKPLASLAREVAFEGCTARRKRDRPECRASAAAQRLACDQACGTGPVDGPQSRLGRCLSACKIAFTRCKKGCAKRR